MEVKKDMKARIGLASIIHNLPYFLSAGVEVKKDMKARIG